MKRVRDHYFAAWLIIEKQLKYNKGDECIEFNICAREYDEYMKEYKKVQPLLKEIRKTVKLLNSNL